MKPKISILDEAFVYRPSYATAAARVEPGTADAEERKRSKHWRIAMKAVEWIRRQLRLVGPYLAVELFLPGGSIVALLLWTYRHRTPATNREATAPAKRPAPPLLSTNPK